MRTINQPRSTTDTLLQNTLDLLRQAKRAFGSRLLLATSLGPQSLVILDLAQKNGVHFEVAMLDTGLLFDETIALAKQVEEHYQLSIRRVRPTLGIEEAEHASGGQLWKVNGDRCCQLRKVLPMQKLLGGYSAWITGLRREQSQERAQTKSIEWDQSFGVVKLSPLVDWTGAQVRNYLQDNQVPSNPLLEQGYKSIGCEPCTSLSGDEGERSGRWAGTKKTECGLHSIGSSNKHVRNQNSPISSQTNSEEGTIS